MLFKLRFQYTVLHNIFVALTILIKPRTCIKIFQIRFKIIEAHMGCYFARIEIKVLIFL